MTGESAITAEIKSMLGVEAEPLMEEVEKGHIKRFAEAMGDPNPLWQDQEYAGKSRYRGIIAPPTFLLDLALKPIVPKLMQLKCPLTRHLYGGMDMEFLKPMRPGDVITARSKLSDVYEKEGRGEKLLFMVIGVSYTNQRGELVAKGNHTFIKR
jgi:acyl dehydratase